MKHFSIKNGIYVYERKFEDRSAVIFLNGTNQKQELDLTAYKEILPKESATDIISGKTVNLSGKIQLEARENMILEF